jgi:enterochelin esterase-like enzyme
VTERAETERATAEDAGSQTAAEHPAPALGKRRVSRRTVIIGSAAAAVVVAGGVGVPFAVENRILPGRSLMHRMLGLNGPAGTIPSVAPGPMISGSFRSDARLGADCGWAVSYPPGSAPGKRLPVLVVLHGYSGDHTSSFGTHQALDRFLAQAVQHGSAPFAIAAVDGGNSYWHPRSSGEDSGAMITDEFLPLLAHRGLDTSRVGLMGWSMGGYGALRLAGLLGSDRVAAVGAESPALWHTAQETARGAFDDAADFATHTVFGRQKELTGIPVRIDCGTGDGFYPAARDYAQSLTPRAAGGFTPGGHDIAYWNRVAPQQLAFIGSNFA